MLLLSNGSLTYPEIIPKSTNLNIYPTRKVKNPLARGHQGTMLILPEFLLCL